ncbi:MAG: hypothetical protein ACR2MN_07525 [Acidimicrobiales bacterium]
MTPREVLAELAHLRVIVTEAAGRPVLDGIMDDALVDAARSHRWLFTWGIEGARGFRDPNGAGWVTHTWHACDTCAQVQLLDPKRKQARSCSLTVGCQGRMRPAPAARFQPAEMARSLAS